LHFIASCTIFMIENYFKLFGISEAFVIDQVALKQQFLLLSKKYHPDFFVNSSEIEKEEALQKIATINKGFKILSNTNETIEYVLLLNGILNPSEKYNLPNDFLLEMMELNEKIADAKFENYAVALESCKNEIETIETAIYANVKDYIEKYNESFYSQEGLLQVKEYFFKHKYVNKLKQELSHLG
jgi:molecular chaperone HscB